MKICNIGYNGVGKYKPIDYKDIYICWISLLNRCYNKNNNSYKFYGLKNIIVCQEWHNFQNFCYWYLNKKEEYKDIDFRLNLDKDILCNVKGLKNKIYSPETCLLIPEEINYYFCDCNNLFVGAYKRKDTNNYQVRFQFRNKKFNLGCYDNFYDAKYQYLIRKKYYLDILLFEYKYKIPEYIYTIIENFDFLKILEDIERN